MKLLIETGAQPNLDKTFVPPLHAAVAHGHRDCVKTLVESGANVNVWWDEFYAGEESMQWDRPWDYSGTPLAHAIFSENQELFEYLISLGADVNQSRGGSFNRDESLISNVSHCVGCYVEYDGFVFLKQLSQCIVEYGARPTEAELYDGFVDGFFSSFISHWLTWEKDSVKICCKGMYDSLAAIFKDGADVNMDIEEPLSEWCNAETGERLPDIRDPGLEFMLHIGKLDCAKMYWLAGSNQGRVASWNRANMVWYSEEDTEFPIDDAGKTQIMDFIENAVQKPRSLMDISRIVVRKQLKCHISKKVGSLGIPRELEVYLLLPEMDSLISAHKSQCG